MLHSKGSIDILAIHRMGAKLINFPKKHFRQTGGHLELKSSFNSENKKSITIY